jgi:hypothetical protein
MNGHSDDEQADSASYHSLAAAEKNLETLLASSVGCRIAPIELSSCLNEESKL